MKWSFGSTLHTDELIDFSNIGSIITDISNDDLDDEQDEEDLSSSLALSYKSTNSFMASLASDDKLSHGAVKKQRSLTPDKKYSDGDSMGSIRKQRSLTPDKRSLTPEHRLSGRSGSRQRSKNDLNSSQSSLLSSKLSSGSRNSTLDRHRSRYEDARNSSRSSSSSSSYSGGGDPDNPMYRRGSSTRGSGNYRIRRSR